MIDVIAVLTGSDRPSKYWKDLKKKLSKEGSELSEKIGQLKMQSADGKYYKTDVADLELIFTMLGERVTTVAAGKAGDVRSESFRRTARRCNGRRGPQSYGADIGS